MRALKTAIIQTIQMGSSRQKTYKTLFIFLSIFVFVYGLSKIFPIVRGPQIFVEGITNGENHGPIAFISGKTVGAQELKLNNNELLLDEKGNFSDTLLLHEGYNIISLSAKDTFGREKIKHFEITASSFNFEQIQNSNYEEIETEENTEQVENNEDSNIIETENEILVESGTELLN